MKRISMNFSAIALVLSVGLVASADAAPSVRVLGSANPASTGMSTGNSGVKTTSVKTGNTIKPSVLGANAGAKKSASIKTISPNVANMQPVSRAASNRSGTAGTSAIATGNAARFPGIASKTNIQKSYQAVTTAPGTGSGTGGAPTGYDLQNMSDQLGNKVDKESMANYYTKEEIDGMNSGYYTAEQVDEKLSGIDTSASSAYIRYLTNTVNTHTEQIQEILASEEGIYDLNSGETKSVFFVTDFDADAVLGLE